MKTAEKIHFFLGRVYDSFTRRRQKAWNGLSILVIQDDTAAPPRSYRINYYLLFFVGLIIVFLPAFAFGVALNRGLRQSRTGDNLEHRRSQLLSMMLLTEEKRDLFGRMESQLSEFAGIAARVQEEPQVPLNIVTAALEAEDHSSPDTFTRNLIRIQGLRTRSRNFQNSAGHVLNFFWHRVYIHHIMPRGRPLNQGVGSITSLWGSRRDPLGRIIGGEHHNGMDFAAGQGEPLLATAPGVVFKSGDEGGYGQAIRIHHGLGYTTLYAHCSELVVEEGQWVRRGQMVAKMGATGRATGTHIHYEVKLGWGRSSDPLPYVQLK